MAKRKVRRGPFEPLLDVILKKEWMKTIETLKPLAKLSPNNLDNWVSLASCYYHVGQYENLWQATVNVVRLNPGDSKNWFNVANAAMMNHLWFTAQYYADQFLIKFPNDKYYEQIQELRQRVENVTTKVLASPNTERGASSIDLREMEQAEIAITNGDYLLAERLINQTLQRSPTLIAPLNVLSLLYSAQGKFSEAITTARQVLAKYPNNIHALSNLAQLLWRTAQTSEAELIAAKLNQPTSTNALLLKQLEALSFMGKDSAVIQLFEQSEQRFKENLRVSDYSPMTYHLVSVAYAHQGNEKQAKQLWETALEKNKNFEPARQNLDNLKQPFGQRFKAFPFSRFKKGE